MMRVLFLALLMANLVALLVFEAMQGQGLEPQRLAQQKNSERLSVVDLNVQQDPKPAPPCLEAGEFTQAEANKFEATLASLSLPELPRKRLVLASPAQMVMLPPQASEAMAQQRVAQLKTLGFKDVSVIRDEPARRWGISLGVFNRLELAEARLSALRQVGVSDARVEENPFNSARLAFQLGELDASTRVTVSGLLSGMAGVSLHPCP